MCLPGKRRNKPAVKGKSKKLKLKRTQIKRVKVKELKSKKAPKVPIIVKNKIKVDIL